MRDTPKPLLSLHRKEQLAGCSLGYRLYFCFFQTLIRPSVTNHHAKRVRRCRSADNGRLVTRLDFRRFLTVLVDRRLLGSQCCLSTGLVANDIRITNIAMPCRHDQMLPVVCRNLGSLSHCWFVCVFSPVG